RERVPAASARGGRRSWGGGEARRRAARLGGPARFTGVRGAIALLAIVLMSCTQGITPTAGVSPSPPSPSSSSPSSSCRLPISLVLDLKRDLQGAFVDFPGGTVTVDPSGAGGASYSRRFKRWLPVAPNAISTDGTRY